MKTERWVLDLDASIEAKKDIIQLVSLLKKDIQKAKRHLKTATNPYNIKVFEHMIESYQERVQMLEQRLSDIK